MAKLFDMLDDEFTDAEIQALAEELEAKWRELVASDAFIVWAALVGLVLTIWIGARAF